MTTPALVQFNAGTAGASTSIAVTYSSPNTAGNGTQTLTLASLGLSASLLPIASKGFGDTTINPVTPAAITQITLSARDGRFLIGAP